MREQPLLPLDTSADADAVQLAAYRRLSGCERVATVFRLNEVVRTAAMAGIRARHPHYDDATVRLAWQRLILGDELMRRLVPGRDLVAP